MNEQRTNDVLRESIRAAQVVLPCAELQATLDFFVERLGFQLDRISPADDPRSAQLSGHGVQLLLRRGDAEAPGTLQLLCDDPATLGGGERELLAPNGTRIELHEAARALDLPPARPELVVSRAGADDAWITGRAGMQYRDLIPGRQGGRFIASHIRIPDGGPVPDHVHFHAVRFQMIFCVRGWVRVVYEDQGPAFVLAAGDCVLQPSRIRHRVLECSPGLEVVELASPAEHDTFLDHELGLPTVAVRPERDFGGQRFVRHEASSATWRPWVVSGFEARDTGIGEATAGLASAAVVRAKGAAAEPWSWRHDGELLFAYVLAGRLVFEGASPEPLQLGSGDNIVVPAGLECAVASRSDELELLLVRLPAAP